MEKPGDQAMGYMTCAWSGAPERQVHYAFFAERFRREFHHNPVAPLCAAGLGTNIRLHARMTKSPAKDQNAGAGPAAGPFVRPLRRADTRPSRGRDVRPSCWRGRTQRGLAQGHRPDWKAYDM